MEFVIIYFQDLTAQSPQQTSLNSMCKNFLRHKESRGITEHTSPEEVLGKAASQM